MPIPISDLISYVHILIGTAAPVIISLVCIQLKPLRTPLRLLILLAAMSVAGIVASTLALPELAWFGIMAVYTVAIVFTYQTDIYYSGIAALLTALLIGLDQLAYHHLLLADLERLMWVFDLLLVLSAGLCCRFNVELLPTPSALPIISDKEHRRKLRISLLYVAISLAVANLWLFFALSVLEMLPGKLQLALTSLTMAISLLLLGYIRRLTFSVVERIEALVDKQYQSNLLSFMQVIRSQRHDFNFHMRTISTLIEQAQYQECNEYVHQMVRNASAMNDMLPLHHPANSALIHAFWEMALQKGIDFTVDISSDLAHLPCTIYETNTMIGNLLQNAIDEVEAAHSHGPIRLLILFRGGYYTIKVTNPCSKEPEELQNMFQPGYSTKQSHEGLGLAAVRHITDRYDGMVFPEFDQGQINLIVQIPFSA